MDKYDDEATQFENSTTEQANDTTPNGEVEAKESKRGGLKQAAKGAATGLLIGSVSTFFMGMKSAHDSIDDTNGKDEEGNHKEELSHPEWVDDDISVATSVDDDMSFSEAFAAARAEVGAGGCFEWHGNLYGTYYADEWNQMTAEQRAEWGDHFSWNHIDHSQSNVAQHSTTAQHKTTDATAHTAASDDDIEVVSVNHNENNNFDHNSHNVHQTSSEVGGESGEPEIEILGVFHDDDTNANLGGMNIDGQGVILIDVDNDLTFDYMASDSNNDGHIDQSEMVDIQDQNITVADLGGFTNSSDDLYASNDGPDYSNDMAYDS